MDSQISLEQIKKFYKIYNVDKVDKIIENDYFNDIQRIWKENNNISAHLMMINRLN